MSYAIDTVGVAQCNAMQVRAAFIALYRPLGSRNFGAKTLAGAYPVREAYKTNEESTSAVLCSVILRDVVVCDVVLYSGVEKQIKKSISGLNSGERVRNKRCNVRLKTLFTYSFAYNFTTSAGRKRQNSTRNVT